MKKNLLFAFLFSLFSFNSNSEASVHKIIKRVDLKTSSDGMDNNCYYFYDEKNNLIWIQESSVRYEYENNAAGQPVKRTTYSWVEYDKEYRKMGYETYSYYDDGNLKTLTKYNTNYAGKTIIDRYEYSDYQNGMAKRCEWYENDDLFYAYIKTLTIQDGLVTKAVTSQYDPETKRSKDYDTKDFTYINGYCIKEVTTTGSLLTKKTATTTYTYTDLDATYAPSNFKVEENNGTVSLSWNAVPGATSYIVTYDQTRATGITNTSYSTAVNTGTRSFAVQAVINGVERNTATPVSTVIEDGGKLPITDLAAGQSYKTIEKPDAGEDREFYNIPLTWTLPEGHSEIKDIIIYYDSHTYGPDCYVKVGSNSAISYTLRVAPHEMAEWDDQGVPYKGINTPIYAVIEYVTGKSEKSNIVYVNPFGETSGISEISANQSQITNSTSFNVAGQQVSNNAKGIIIKNGKKSLNR